MNSSCADSNRTAASRGVARPALCQAIWTQAPHEDEKKLAARTVRRSRGNGVEQVPEGGDQRERERIRFKTRLTSCIRQHGADDELAVCEDISPIGMCFRSKRLYESQTPIDVAVPYSPDSAEYLHARQGGVLGAGAEGWAVPAWCRIPPHRHRPQTRRGFLDSPHGPIEGDVTTENRRTGFVLMDPKSHNYRMLTARHGKGAALDGDRLVVHRNVQVDIAVGRFEADDAGLGIAAGFLALFLGQRVGGNTLNGNPRH